MADIITFLRQLIVKYVFLGGSDRQGKKILERKTSVSNKEILEQYEETLEQYWHFLAGCQAHKHILTVHKNS